VKTVARVALAIVVLTAGLLVMPRPAARVVMADAVAQIVPSPTLPDILPSPTPTDDDGGGGGGDNDGGGGDNDGGGNDGGDGGIDLPGGGNDRGGRGGKRSGPRSGPTGEPSKRESADDASPLGGGGFKGLFRVSGSFSTDRLVTVAAELRALGWSTEQIARKVYAPFIIGGPASFVDTWGAPRYGPAPGQIRTHEGQDVFCKYGDPVLASQRGTIEFDDAGLGGLVARLYRSDGSYWYYAHLSDWNTRDFSDGDAVSPGDVIAYCGNSGNAITSPPHVHFGWYQSNGAAKDPMRPLVTWLHRAERRVLGVVSRATNERVKQREFHMAARRFGDSFAPVVSEVRVTGDSLWASGSSPAAGAFALAESALQAALAESMFDVTALAGPVDATVDEAAGVSPGTTDLDATLAALFNSGGSTSGPDGTTGADGTGESSD
jgi:murein DD-endopeptidase MepM/ murein hydrolase activator NlpD